jgi:hypothetical protein
MEPLNEKELKQLLTRWESPPTPSTLHEPVLPPRTSGWRWLLSGTIRVPVPVGIALIVLVAIWLYSSVPTAPKTTTPQHEEPVLMTGFKPVAQLQPVIIGRSDESNAKQK